MKIFIFNKEKINSDKFVHIYPEELKEKINNTEKIKRCFVSCSDSLGNMNCSSNSEYKKI